MFVPKCEIFDNVVCSAGSGESLSSICASTLSDDVNILRSSTQDILCENDYITKGGVSPLLDSYMDNPYDEIGDDYFYMVTFTYIAFTASMSILIAYCLFVCNVVPTYDEPYSVLKNQKLKNVSRIICTQLNINS